MTLRSNSAAARDIAFHFHSYTNAKKNEAEGSLILSSGKGIYVYDENGKTYIEGVTISARQAYDIIKKDPDSFCTAAITPGILLEEFRNEFTFRFNRRFYPFNAFRSLLGLSADAQAPTYDELYSGEWQHPTFAKE